MGRLAWRLLVAVSAIACIAMGAATGAAVARGRVHGAGARQLTLQRVLRRQARQTGLAARASSLNSTPGDSDLADESAEYGFERSAPAASVSGQALLDANSQANSLSVTGGAWQDMTTAPYNAEPSNYTDPFWSNIGAGFSLVGGRTTALVSAPGGIWYQGTADGGVWRSANQGATWTPITDHLPSESIGALAVDPVDGSVWIGTGEANTNADAYAGVGVYTYSPGSGLSLVGGQSNPIISRSVYNITFDPQGNAYVATNNGLFRYDAASGQWAEVLDPAGAVPPTPYDNQVTNVQVVPGTNGKTVIAAIGWRGAATAGDPNEGLEHNGFYESTDGGQTFTEVTPTGAINDANIGRTTFAYSADGSKLYAIVESPSKLAAGDETSLQGIFLSSGSPASVVGPWKKIADEDKLAASGSALAVGSGYGVGIQSWYNQDLTVDPNDPDHVYAGLEEVFQSENAGQTWVTASPYWNYGLACDPNCPNTTHPDQHAMMIANNRIVIGNDGGVYSRPLSDDRQYGDWSDLNATMQSWQYYDGRAGTLPGGGLGIWGGLQDNGTSVLASGQSQMDEPAGGDGFDVIVDPTNANRMVGEYADGAMYSSTNGGHAFNSFVTPGCDGQATVGETPMAGCDPSMRFLTPLVPDGQNVNTWATGGEYVWISKAGWKTSCTSASSCSWTDVFDTGADNAVTALASTDNGNVVYAAWVGGGGEPGPEFGRGIATNYGGTWHELDVSGLPDRYISGMTVDPSNSAHAYAIFNAYSRRWIPGGGVGHVYETYDGGQTWQDISGNLPDIPSDAMVDDQGTLALATDLGTYTAPAGEGANTVWSRLGSGLPTASVNDITLGPDGYVYAATHGRGIWRLQLPGGSGTQTTQARR